MASDIEGRFRQLMGTSAGLVLAEYLRERIDKKKDELVRCNETMFKSQQGRILELEALLKETGK